MGTIIVREKRDGTKSFTAQIRIKKNGKIAYSEAQTFSRKAAASAWLKKREVEVSRPGGMEQAKSNDATLGQSIQKYIDESKKNLGRTKRQCLNTLLKHPIAEMRGGDIITTDLTSLVRDLSEGWRPDAEPGDDRLPQTVANYMSHLGAVFSIAKPMWGHELDYQAFQSALLVSKKMGSITSSGKRNRRPTIEELDKLMDYFANRSRLNPVTIPMCDVILFGIFSTRRQSEITSIRWDDFEPEHKRVLVRDMKHPGEKVGNDVWCDLPAEAVAIIQRMPKDDERIFPYNSRTIGAYFTNAGHVLSIIDLHFHDLRHDGISRLFELGGDIPRAAGVSGHRSWSSLKRYTHIRQVGDKYAGWKWLPKPTLQSEAA